MATLEITYAGGGYRVMGRSLEEVQQHIAVILASGNPGWIEAFDGYGSTAPCHLLITPGVPVAICATPEG